MTDYANDPSYPSIKASPVNHPWLKATSDFLRGAKEIGNKAEIPDWVPLLGGEGVGDLVLGNSDREIGKWSMGSSPFSENREGLGSRIPMLTDARKKDVADVVSLGMDVAPMLKPMAEGGKWLAKEGGKEAALHIANGMNGEGILAKPLAGVSQMNIMAGKNAKLARHDLMSDAERRLAGGDDAATVWKDTGWGRAPDGEMRFEIPDNPAGYSPNKEYFRQLDSNAGRISDAYAAREMKGYVDANNGSTPQQAAEWFAQREGRDASPTSLRKVESSGYSLSDLTDQLRMSKNGTPDFMKLGSRVRNIYDNPELYANYPQLGDMQMKFKTASKMDGAWGQFDGKGVNVRDTVGWNPKYGHSVLEHELTHGVQRLEGFHGGSNPKHIADNPSMYSLDPDNLNPVDAYKRVAGEADARLSQARIGMTPEQRAGTYPFDPDYYKQATGVHPDDLIYKSKGGSVPVAQSRDPLRDAMMREKGIPEDPSTHTSANKSALKKLNDAFANNPGLTNRESLRGGGDIIKDSHVLDERPIVQPEDLLGKYGVQVQGDRTAAGKTLHEVNGVPLDGEVNLQGGSEYARVHAAHGTGAAWASMKDAAANKQKQFRMVANKTGESPLGIYSAMSRDDGANFSHHVSEAMVRQLRALDLPESVIKDVNQQVWTGGTGAKAQGRRDFVGINSPDLISQIMGKDGFAMKGAGEIRKALVAALRMPGLQDKGVPHFGDAIKAVTDPALYGVENASSGHTIFKSRPDQELMKNVGGVGSHSSYDTMIPGEYMGGFERQIPGGIMFPKTYEKHATLGRNSHQTQRSMFLNQQDYEHFDQQWLDGVMNYLRGQQ